MKCLRTCFLIPSHMAKPFLCQQLMETKDAVLEMSTWQDLSTLFGSKALLSSTVAGEQAAQDRDSCPPGLLAGQSSQHCLYSFLAALSCVALALAAVLSAGSNANQDGHKPSDATACEHSSS